MFIKHFISSAQCKSVVTFLAKLRFLQVCEIHTKTHMNEFPFFRGAPLRSIKKKKKKSQFCFFRIGRSFFCLFFKCRVGPNFRVGRVMPI